MSQPLLGLVATALTIVLSLAFVSFFEPGTFAGWVAFLMLCLIPVQVVTVVIAPQPPYALGKRQPARGVILLLANVAAAIVIAFAVLMLVGEGVSPPGPIPVHYTVVVVPTTFFLALAFAGWPFTRLSRSMGVAGGFLLVTAYASTYVIVRLFFDYDFLEGTPVDLASAPDGMYPALRALMFSVTALAGLFVLLHFELWPLTLVPALMKQPVRGVVLTIVSLALTVLLVQATDARDKDPMWVLTRITAPFIFGTIIVLNMLGSSLFARLRQPARGVAHFLAAMVIGVALARLYGAFSDWRFNELPMGQPGYEYEIWLANALLAVTFPALICVAVYFDFWPLSRTRAAASAGAESART